MNFGVADVMAKAIETMSEGAFQSAGSALTDAKAFVRGEIQNRTSSEIEKIIQKLQSSEQISDEEIDLVKTWIVGDAMGYSKIENNFQDWISEYERLQTALASYDNKDCSSEDLLTLNGILEDAARISYDIANFLEKKESIRKFEAAVGDGLDKDERDILVRVLLGKLRSDNY